MAAAGVPAFLFVGTEWAVTSGGISSFNMLLATLVARANPGIRVLCAVTDATDQQKRDAAADGVTLVLPKRFRGVLPSLSLPLEGVPLDTSVRWVVGHAHITGHAALDQVTEYHKGAKFVFFNHVIPEEVEPLKENVDSAERMHDKQKELLDLATKAAIVFSVGPRMYEHFSGLYRGVARFQAPHVNFLPPLSPLFSSESPPAAPDPARPATILCFGRSEGVHYVKGFDVAARALGVITDNFRGAARRPPRLLVYGAAKHAGADLRTKLQQESKSDNLELEVHPYGTPHEVLTAIRRSTVCLMPSRSEPFGLAGLEAIAAGIPVLVTEHSGLALLVQQDYPEYYDRMVVSMTTNVQALENDAATWGARIVNILRDPRAAFAWAAELRNKLISSRTSEKTIAEFVGQCQGSL